MKRIARWARQFGVARAVCLLLLFAIVPLRIADPPPIEELRLRAFDLFQVLKPRQQTARPVVIADIDEASLKEIGQWPWPRTVVADLVTRLTALGAAGLFKLIHPVRSVWDYTCGYRAYQVGVLQTAARCYGDTLVAERGFACMAELLLKLNAVGARFAEIPLQLRYDQKPTATKMGVGSNMRRMLVLLVRWRVRGFDR